MTAACRSCGARIEWVVTAATGRRMPLDLEPTPDGNIVLTSDGRAVVLSPGALLLDDSTRYRSHFATCPNADQHRKDRTT